jgi:undecaprenyl pyrophosphate phosphatase UppP
MLQWIREPLPQANTLVLLAGFVASLLTGAWSIGFLLRFVSRHSYVPFVLYRMVLAVLVVLLLVR